jgi:ParB family chromosome partitioning protein
LSLEEIGETAGESAKTVQRYIWLSRLSDQLLEMVDNKKIGIVQAVDLSFLSEDSQQLVWVALDELKTGILAAQSAKLKECDKNGELTFPMVKLILEQEKPVQRKVVIKSDRISNYFPESYSQEEIEKVIYKLLDDWKSGRKESQK